MNKNRIFMFALLATAVPLSAMEEEQKVQSKWNEGGPMNAAWFSDESTPYAWANRYLDKCQWQQADQEYTKQLEAKEGTAYEQDMALLNRASARFAQGRGDSGWQVFDRLLAARPNRMNKDNLTDVQSSDAVDIDTTAIGIGDIFHFFKALKDVPGKKRLFVKGFLHKALESMAKHYKVELINPNNVKFGEARHSTHLISLLGLTQQSPADLAPSQVLLTVPEQCAQIIRGLLEAHSDKKKAVVFCGVDNRKAGGATVMGGKKLNHRHLDAAAFEALLKKYPQLMLISGNPVNRINFDQQNKSNTTMSTKYGSRVIQLPEEDDPFDQSIGLALIVNEMGGSVAGFLADNGPSNVYATALTQESKDHTAYILPNVHDFDMRMAGNGSSYRQPLTGCWVYPCDNPEQQSHIIMGAYQDLS